MTACRSVTMQVVGVVRRSDVKTGKDQNPHTMKQPGRAGSRGAKSFSPPRFISAKWGQIAGFSLVEVTLALGVAAICLVTMLGLLPAGVRTQQNGIQQTTANQILAQISSFLRADVRLPPGLYHQVCPDPPDPDDPCHWDELHGRWANETQQHNTMYFTNTGKQTGNLDAASPPAEAVFRVKITYNPVPPTGNTSVANVVVSWPAPVDPDNGGVPAGSVKALLAVNR